MLKRFARWVLKDEIEFSDRQRIRLAKYIVHTAAPVVKADGSDQSVNFQIGIDLCGILGHGLTVAEEVGVHGELDYHTPEGLH